MVDFSIELITRRETTLKLALDSIANQTYGSFEIVCANSSDDSNVSKILEDYSVRHKEVGPVRHLMGRDLAHGLSQGKYSMIMDSTRILKPEALETLEPYIADYGMVAIKEGSAGKGFWVRQADRYRSSSERNVGDEMIVGDVKSFVLPRLYKRELLNTVFSSLRSIIPRDVFESIGYGEHHLIFQEAVESNASFYHYKAEDLLLHFEDTSVSSIYRKYKSYGKDQKILKGLTQYKAGSLNSHRRNMNLTQLRDNAICLPLISIRTLAFIVGMLS